MADSRDEQWIHRVRRSLRPNLRAVAYRCARERRFTVRFSHRPDDVHAIWRLVRLALRGGFRYSVGLNFLERKCFARQYSDTGGFSGLAHSSGSRSGHFAFFIMIIEDLQHKYEGLKQRIM